MCWSLLSAADWTLTQFGQNYNSGQCQGFTADRCCPRGEDTSEQPGGSFTHFTLFTRRQPFLSVASCLIFLTNCLLVRRSPQANADQSCACIPFQARCDPTTYCIYWWRSLKWPSQAFKACEEKQKLKCNVVQPSLQTPPDKIARSKTEILSIFAILIPTILHNSIFL